MLGGPARAEAAQRALASAFAPRAVAANVGRAHIGAKVGAVAALLALNVALFIVPLDLGFLGALAYPGAFLVTLFANAAVVVPIPYIPVVAHIARTADSVALVVVAAALGSALGESAAFFVGRVERDLFAGHPLYERLRHVAKSPWRTGLFLFAFAVPLNPVFDVGGLAAGALGVPYRLFLLAVGLGRLVRFAILAALAMGVWSTLDWLHL